ncbi:hypothetical protein Ddye_021430 [Dipteronia dyeriana]|uniref:SWIM-type domain-containing protein n=1 Tax=Dipteronia dyeriana TaxID=168575 RepID=A0AAD9U1L1_9ROSI|nr:hypothetical protein Ddye_021430 [Dipteronia dyeriana]
MLYDVIISSLVKIESGRRKYRLQRDSDVRFLLLDQTVVPEVYVDLVEKVVRDVRDQPTVPSRISQIPSIVHGAPNPPSFATVRESVSSTQQLPLRKEVPIWDGDCGFPKTCEADEQERVNGNDSYASDGDETHQPREVLSSPEDHVVDTNSDSDLDGQDVADRNTEGRNQYTNTEGRISGIVIFDTKQKLKNEFGNYALNEKFNPRIRWSTKNRFEAGCNDIKCDFALRATYRDGSTYWVVKKFAHVHTCTLDTYESHFRKVSSIVGEMFAPKFNTNGRTIRPTDIITEMHEQHGVQLLYTKAWRAKEHAKTILYGKPEDSYQLLPAYFHLLKVTNLGTLTAIHTDLNNNFLYAFFALGQCIKGFQTVIRPVITIDATHLKGAFDGVIYVASCKDEDEHAYPEAFGVGDGETENSWTWFLERLREAIREVGGMLFVFDRHASIAKALSIVYPNVPHCICFFHLKQNLNPRLKGWKEVLDVYCKAAYCSTSRQFNLEMDEIKKIHQGTYDTLMSIWPDLWSCSQCPGRRYQMMTTNIAEVLNNCIQKAPRLPITAAMEFLGDMLQRWFNDRREQAGKNPTYLGNAAVGHCKERNEWSLTYNVYLIELTRYLVKDGKHDGLVDIEHRMCTCRNWDLDQLPCDHAIAVARFTKTNFNSLCHEYYNTSWM